MDFIPSFHFTITGKPAARFKILSLTYISKATKTTVYVAAGSWCEILNQPKVIIPRLLFFHIVMMADFFRRFVWRASTAAISALKSMQPSLT